MAFLTRLPLHVQSCLIWAVSWYHASDLAPRWLPRISSSANNVFEERKTRPQRATDAVGVWSKNQLSMKSKDDSAYEPGDARTWGNTTLHPKESTL
jgi:hypothetical protein